MARLLRARDDPVTGVARRGGAIGDFAATSIRTTDAAMDDPGPEMLMAEAARAVRAGAGAAARDTLIACVRRHAGFGPAYVALADLFDTAGQPGQAADVLSRGLAVVTDAEGRGRIARRLLPILAGMAPSGYHPTLERDVLACLTIETVDPQPLARLAARVLTAKYPDTDPAGDDPLLIALLTRCINVDAALEARLVAMRRRLVGTGRPDALAEAIALQAFANEYVWPIGEAEEAALRGAIHPVLAAMYRRPAADEGLPPALARRLVAEPAQERRLAAALPVLGGDQRTDAVRDHYEANPYPRWTVRPASTPLNLADRIATLPGIDRAALPDAPLDLLVAGAGTGYEAIDLAQGDPSLAIVAIDVSRASLAHAQRMAGSLDIRFVAGDLLHIGKPQWRFGVIVSTGVLHHLDDPAAGLAALAGVLLPGGTMRIALYSRRARALVREAHALIAAHGWAPTIAGIRAFRAAVLAMPMEAPLARLAQSEDFWSASGCRDLVFHVREHQYDLPEIGVLLANAGLRLVAVEAPPAARAAYDQRGAGEGDGLDLARWDAVEAAAPESFAGMFHLWAQKSGTAPARET